MQVASITMCSHGTHRKGGGRDHMRHQNAYFLHSRWLSNPLLLFVACLVLTAKICRVRIVFDGGAESFAADSRCSEAPAVSSTVLVSYSYFQKDEIQRQNFEFFMAVGMGMSMSSGFQRPNSTDFVLVINGDVCSPCTAILPSMKEDSRYKNSPDISMAWSSSDLAVLQRRENEGMDFAAHNVSTVLLVSAPLYPQSVTWVQNAIPTELRYSKTLHYRGQGMHGWLQITMEWLHWTGAWHKYRYFILLNSSVRGPFYPSYMGPSWQWTRAFTDRLVGDVKLVSSSLVCLPEVDAGGLGPKVSSSAFDTMQG